MLSSLNVLTLDGQSKGDEAQDSAKQQLNKAKNKVCMRAVYERSAASARTCMCLLLMMLRVNVMYVLGAGEVCAEMGMDQM